MIANARLSNGDPDPDHTLVEILVHHKADCTWRRAWVTLREAWIMHQPGLLPPPGREVTRW